MVIKLKAVSLAIYVDAITNTQKLIQLFYVDV